jgi:hypothetical protein
MLLALSDHTTLVNQAAELAAVSIPMAQAAIAIGHCEPTAGAQMESISADDRRTPTYWALQLELDAERGDTNALATRLYAIQTFHTPTQKSSTTLLNPLNENNSQGSVDSWGYDRLGIQWANSPIELPSPEAGADRLLVDPAGARSSMDLMKGPGHCTPTDAD